MLKATSFNALPPSVLATNGTMAHVSPVPTKLAITAQFSCALKTNVFPVTRWALIAQSFASIGSTYQKVVRLVLEILLAPAASVSTAKAASHATRASAPNAPIVRAFPSLLIKKVVCIKTVLIQTA